jgi:hypothetical protein
MEVVTRIPVAMEMANAWPPESGLMQRLDGERAYRPRRVDSTTADGVGGELGTAFGARYHGASARIGGSRRD